MQLSFGREYGISYTIGAPINVDQLEITDSDMYYTK